MALCICALVLQYYYIYIQNIGSYHAEKSSVIIAPFQGYKVFSLLRNLPFAFLGSYLFPLLVLWFNRKNIDKSVIYSWVLVILSLLIFFLFIEDGPRKLHGNFYWQIVPSSYILYLTSFVNLLKNDRIKKINSHNTIQDFIIYIFFGLSVLFGILFFLKNTLYLNFS